MILLSMHLLWKVQGCKTERASLFYVSIVVTYHPKYLVLHLLLPISFPNPYIVRC